MSDYRNSPFQIIHAHSDVSLLTSVQLAFISVVAREFDFNVVAEVHETAHGHIIILCSNQKEPLLLKPSLISILSCAERVRYIRPISPTSITLALTRG